MELILQLTKNAGFFSFHFKVLVIAVRLLIGSNLPGSGGQACCCAVESDFIIVIIVLCIIIEGIPIIRLKIDLIVR